MSMLASNGHWPSISASLVMSNPQRYFGSIMMWRDAFIWVRLLWICLLIWIHIQLMSEISHGKCVWVEVTILCYRCWEWAIISSNWCHVATRLACVDIYLACLRLVPWFCHYPLVEWNLFCRDLTWHFIKLVKAKPSPAARWHNETRLNYSV